MKKNVGTIVKYLDKTFRVVVAKTVACYIVVTVHPYPNTPWITISELGSRHLLPRTDSSRRCLAGLF